MEKCDACNRNVKNYRRIIYYVEGKEISSNIICARCGFLHALSLVEVYLEIYGLKKCYKSMKLLANIIMNYIELED